MTPAARLRAARRALIIEQAHSLSWPRRLGLGALTGLLWGIWLYLWSPLITVVLWGGAALTGWHIARPRLLDGSLMPVLLRLMLVALVLGLILLSWALSQYLRYRNVERRRWTLAVTPAELAHSELTHPGLTEARIVLWQSARCLRVHHDADGHVEDADVLVVAGADPLP